MLGHVFSVAQSCGTHTIRISCESTCLILIHGCHLESSCTFGGAFSSSYKTLVRVQRLIESMNNANVDVIVYPTWSNPPRLIGDYYSADGAKTDCNSSTHMLFLILAHVLSLLYT